MLSVGHRSVLLREVLNFDLCAQLFSTEAPLVVGLQGDLVSQNLMLGFCTCIRGSVHEYLFYLPFVFRNLKPKQVRGGVYSLVRRARPTSSSVPLLRPNSTCPSAFQLVPCFLTNCVECSSLALIRPKLGRRSRFGHSSLQLILWVAVF
jgi:hypothetical protein